MRARSTRPGVSSLDPRAVVDRRRFGSAARPEAP
jgi:hypothetical protein